MCGSRRIALGCMLIGGFEGEIGSGSGESRGSCVSAACASQEERCEIAYRPVVGEVVRSRTDKSAHITL